MTTVQVQYALSMVVAMAAVLTVLTLYSMALESLVLDGAKVLTEDAHEAGLATGAILHIANEGEYGVMSEDDVEELGLDESCNPDIPVFNDQGTVRTYPNLGPMCGSMGVQLMERTPFYLLNEQGEEKLVKVEIGGEES